MSGTPVLDFKEEFKLKLADLEQKLKVIDPNMGLLLDQIHRQLQSIPELAYILTEEEIGRIVEGSKRTMMIEIAATKPKESLKKMTNEATADDF